MTPFLSKCRRFSGLVITGILLSVLFSLLPGLAEGEVAKSEYEIKAVFIYKFLHFIEWTRNESNDFAICVMGENPFDSGFQPILEKTVNGKRITFKRIEYLNESTCDVLFISASEDARLSSIIHRIRGLEILTIGDTKGYAEKGVMINFYTEQDKVRFEINPESAEKAGLKISSKLMSLATVVHSKQ